MHQEENYYKKSNAPQGQVNNSLKNHHIEQDINTQIKVFKTSHQKIYFPEASTYDHEGPLGGRDEAMVAFHHHINWKKKEEEKTDIKQPKHFITHKLQNTTSSNTTLNKIPQKMTASSSVPGDQ